MELKRLITHFTYRIAPKPEGGFIAHATDPSIPPLEAATREELQRKIQANIASALAAEFPGLKLPLENQELKFAIHSVDPKAQSIERATQEEIESHFTEKLIPFLGKHLMPELSQALAARGNSGDIKVFVNHKMGFTLKAGAHGFGLGTARGVPVGSSQPADARIEDTNLGDRSTNVYSGGSDHTISNSPIIPEASSSWNLLRFLLAALIIAGGTWLFALAERVGLL